MTTTPNSLEVFFAYSHADEELRDELEKHLSALRRLDAIVGWHDRKIGPGKEWDSEIDDHLNSAHLILLLVSADFIHSDYCYGVETKRAMERHAAKEARGIPIILRDCDWHVVPFGKLQALPKDGTPVTSWSNRDVAFADIARGVRRIVEELRSAPQHIRVQPPSAHLTLTMPNPTLRLEVSDTQHAPLAPHIFTGRVHFSGPHSVNPQLMSAWVDDSQVPGATAQVDRHGGYTLIVVQAPGLSFAGKTIRFKVGDRPAKETAVWRAGDATILNLTAAVPTPSTPPQGLTPPHIFTGSVLFRGLPSQDGARVSAYVDGREVPGASGAISGGRYTLQVVPPAGISYVGKTVTFAVFWPTLRDRYAANQKAIWRAGDAAVLNLTVG